MSFPTPNRADHLAFVRIEGWSVVKNARGKNVGHHNTFELPLPDGRILRTRISKPQDKSRTYGKSLWNSILRDQLDVTEQVFWDCVQHKILPQRGTPEPAPESIPVDLYHLLTAKAGLGDAQVRAMTRDQAIAAATEYWSRPTF